MKDTNSSSVSEIPPSLGCFATFSDWCMSCQEFVSFFFFNLSRALLFTLPKKNSAQENAFRRILKKEFINGNDKGRVHV